MQSKSLAANERSRCGCGGLLLAVHHIPHTLIWRCIKCDTVRTQRKV